MDGVKAIIEVQTFKSTIEYKPHYYGYLCVTGKMRKKLERLVTEEDLNETPTDRFLYNVGDMTGRFKTWKDVITVGGEEVKRRGIDFEDVLVKNIFNGRFLSYREALKFNPD